MNLSRVMCGFQFANLPLTHLLFSVISQHFFYTLNNMTWSVAIADFSQRTDIELICKDSLLFDNKLPP